MLAKQLSFLANADSAGLVLGARVPIILTSRADSVRSRIASCAVAMLAAHARRAAAAAAVSVGAPMDDYALVLNAGSSSLKFCVYRRPDGERVAAGGARPDRRHRHVAALLREGRRGRRARRRAARRRRCATARAALDALAAWLRVALRRRARARRRPPRRARRRATTPARRSSRREVLDDLRALMPLAPLHQPHNLAAIEAVSERLPDVPQVACFDTSFHRGQPAVAELVPLPREIRDARRAALRLPRPLVRVHRVGAAAGRAGDRRRPRDRRAPRQRRQPVRDEGTARASTARSASPRSTGCAWARGPARSIPASSSTSSRPRAVGARKSRRSSTRSPACSASPGISNDMRDLLGSTEPAARLAVDYFVYRAAKEIGALAAVLGGIDGAGVHRRHRRELGRDPPAHLRGLGVARHRARSRRERRHGPADLARRAAASRRG